MASTMQTPPRTGRRGRPRKHPIDSEPPRKKRKYSPPGSGLRRESGANGRYSSSRHNGDSTSVPRRAPSRRHSDMPSRRSGLPFTPARQNFQPSTSAAAAAASALSQGDNFKPREERSWEEFHPDLDVDASLAVFTSDDVDGVRISDGEVPTNGAADAVFSGSPVTQQMIQMLKQQVESNVAGAVTITPPFKRRPGRPPKRPEAILAAMLQHMSPGYRIPPAPTMNPKERLVLPKPSFRQIETFKAYEKAPGIGINFVDKSFANVGYQESDLFTQPRTFVRGGNATTDFEMEFSATTENNELIFGALAANPRVEYDMDEQDEKWLEVINAERVQQGVEPIRPQCFEITMTLIEKEWHALEKRIPKSNPKPPQTHRPRSSSAAAVNGEPANDNDEPDSRCAVCDDGDCENTNAIVFCDGCDLAVHQECYGVPFIPEGQWLCRKCHLVGRTPPMCIFCPNSEGAFKPTTTSRWSHLLCAIWIPEVSLANATFMEPVQDVEKVPKQRWKLTCYICQQKMGACIQCSNKNCFVAFHVTCARRCQLSLKMKNPHGGLMDMSSLQGYCDKHCPADWRADHDVDMATADAKEFYRRNMKGIRWGDSQQAALAQPAVPYGAEVTDPDANEDAAATVGPKRKKVQVQPPKKIWRLPSGAPIVPHIVYTNIETTLSRWGIRKRKEFVSEACKYWTLKREARGGAALLKRLQQQLETFTSMEMTRRKFAAMGAAGGPKLQKRIEFAEALEGDLDIVLELSKKALKREELKMQDAELLKHLVDTVYFPIAPLLWPILERSQSLDSNYNYFKKGFSNVQAKLELRKYATITDFALDFGQALHDAVYAPEVEEEQPVRLSEVLNEVVAKPKDLRKEKMARAKRIIKVIQSEVLEAATKVADLSQSHEDERRQVEEILDHCLSPPRDVSNDTTGDKAAEDAGEVSTGADAHAPLVNGHTVHDESPKAHDQDVEMTDIGNHADEKASQPTAMVPILLQITSEDDDGPDPSKKRQDSSSSRGGTPYAPDLINADSKSAGNPNPGPLTPPTSENESGSFRLANGGVPWYMSAFEPEGTTVYDEPWAGQEALRGISEELSELDDDIVDGLMDEEEDERKLGAHNGAGPDMLAVPITSKKRARPKRKR